MKKSPSVIFKPNQVAQQSPMPPVSTLNKTAFSTDAIFSYLAEKSQTKKTYQTQPMSFINLQSV